VRHNFRQSKNPITQNLTRFEPEWSKIRVDPRSDNLKLDPIQTRTTRYPRWLEIKWLETRPNPNTNDPKLDNLKPDLTRAICVSNYFKIMSYNIKLLFINSTCTWLLVYFEEDHVKHGFRGDRAKCEFHKEWRTINLF
jgi:hypothetical protein